MSKIHEAIKDKVAVVDVDGSYIYLKHKKLTDSGVSIAPLEQPTCAPFSGCQGITASNVRVMAEKMPRVTSGKLKCCESYVLELCCIGCGPLVGTVYVLTPG